ncbi:imidazole glycerol phosphate synthase subunit HisH [Tepidiphilus margaritifer]|uniref:imidazole glycerol phosphate synthase subunit HisH n=1 Tax=Tepidiphilus margaritifer TaxID=203471 RepID=UPI0004160903|nr:imidazole glycerol phosphate synthase subunit HisH [Tepidiphilus margaritifer]
MNIAVIDYGMGNLRSVQKALQTVAPGVSVRLARTPREVQEADRVVFPGQGAMPDCMGALQRQEMHEAVLRAARERPFLGICVGLQMLFERSEEGGAAGLGLFAGEVVRFPRDGAFAPGQAHLKVPHMGWNRVENVREHPILPVQGSGERYYFVHSYYVAPRDDSLVLARTDYGVVFASAVAHDNLVAVQFHPEKSGRAGLALLERFVRWAP